MGLRSGEFAGYPGALLILSACIAEVVAFEL
jgi:hypothetical protein